MMLLLVPPDGVSTVKAIIFKMVKAIYGVHMKWEVHDSAASRGDAKVIVNCNGLSLLRKCETMPTCSICHLPEQEWDKGFQKDPQMQR